MQKTLIFSAAVAALIGTTDARLSKGKCVNPPLQANFDISKYTGLWYEIERDAAFIFSEGGECVTAQYSANTDGSVHVHNAEYNFKKQKGDSIDGTATCNGPHCAVEFFSFAPKGDYRVVSTDYTEHAIVYSCIDLPFSYRNEDLWILARNKTLSPETHNATHELIKANIPNYDLDHNLHVTIQDNTCVYKEDGSKFLF